MANNKESLAKMYEDNTLRVTKSLGNWTDFLTVMGNLYKYPYHEQLMIYAQRPKATACAEFGLWNDTMNRYVKRGSSGIALIDPNADNLPVKYVFDVSDTGGKRNARKPFLWEMQEHHEEPILDMLKNKYQVDDKNLLSAIDNIANKLAREYYNDNGYSILQLTEDSFLEELDDQNIQVAFENAASVSIAYTLMKRCGLDVSDYFEHEDFSPIFDFNTTATISLLGTAVSEQTEQIFREIAKTIVKTERSIQNEQSNVQTRGGLSNSEHHSAGEQDTNRKVWENEKIPLDEQPQTIVQSSTDERETASTSSGNRPNSQQKNGTNDERPASETASTQQNETPNGMGGTHEQPASTSRGSDFDGADIQLSLFPTEEQQIKTIADRQSVKTQSPSAISMETRVKADKLARCMEDIFNDVDTKYKGTIIADMPDIKSWENNIKSKKKYLTLSLTSPVADMKDNAFTYFNRIDKSDEIALNEAIYNSSFLSQFKNDKDFSISFSPTSIIVFFHNFEDKTIDFNLAPNVEKIALNNEYKSVTPYFEGYSNIKKEYPNNIVLYPLGDFFEAFGDDAKLMDDKFNLNIMYRAVDDSGERTPMIGVPANSLENYVEQLRSDGNDVVVCKNENGEIIPYFMNKLEIKQEIAEPKISDIENSILEWNRDNQSKARVLEYMQAHGRERGTARFLQSEFGGNLNAFEVTNGETKDIIPWAKVQRLLGQLVDENKFHITNEIEPLTVEQTSDIANPLELNAKQTISQAKPITPEVIFFEDLKQIDIDYSKYADGDLIGYNTDGVRFNVGKSGDLTYTTQTTSILPTGEVLGDSMTAEIFTKWQEWKSSLEKDEVKIEPILEQKQPNEPKKANIENSKGENFHIENMNLGNVSKAEKIGYNLDAIKTIKEIESENRTATSDEQQILSQYVGFGGIPEIFEENNSNYGLLKATLTDEEYSAARSSVLNAHYTSPTIVKAIYDTIGNMGFNTGNILEPSCGVGNFFGMLPETMKNSNLYGVELDSITGRIAQKLYPNADISIKGFEKTNFPDSFFDVAIGNVPFGDYGLVEKRYDTQKFKIHDHFFAKSLDKIRPNGVVAFVTSKGTLDKKNSSVRKYLGQRAELIGAIRLPNNAFKANAGTEVTSDIIFLQKRENPIDIVPDWVHLGFDDNDISINSYFIDNPEMILGKMEMQSGRFGDEATCTPIEGAKLDEQLQQAIKNIVGSIPEMEFENTETIKDSSIPADPNVKNYSYTLVDGEVYYRENSKMSKPEVNKSALERIQGMVEVRNCVNKLINYQLDEFSDDDIKQAQYELNILYDKFTEKHGLLNSRGNAMAFSGDNSYYLLCSLEDVNDDGTLKAKADMFTKRTIKQSIKITSVDTPSEALAVSLAEKANIDMEFMSKLTGKNEQEIFEGLKGVIFLNPMNGFNSDEQKYLTADEYLSGNVREKLVWANRMLSANPKFAINVEALEKAQPKDLDASEIEVRLGATWINKSYFEQFMYETFQTPYYLQGESGIKINFANFTGEWSIKNKNQAGFRDVASTSTYGTSRANAYKILDDTLNLRDTRIYDTVTDPDGKERRVLNKNETTLAGQKQQLIKEKFKDWIWNDPERRQDLAQKYNEKFNSTRPREYDGSHITFGGINPEISLREHQVNAIAHILYGDNVLLAHEVGAGKSFEMVAGAMESKRLGLCTKPLLAVPNHLTEQMASEFLRLYPAANILVATKKDFETKNRKKFCARIATGDYDAVIMGHSQFERIPVSLERQERLLDEQINEITSGISEVKASGGEKFTIKQLERTKKGLEQRLEKLQALDKKDDVITFEQLGVDKLIVDEAHAYKNGFVFTKMRNVAGLGSTESQRSADMFMKCRYLDEITGGKGVVFATGTPISNSMVEMYVMQRYLQYNTLKEKGLLHFDAWASTFGETSTTLEINPQGSGYRAKTRFSKFYNLPELMNIFKEVADIKTADQLNLPTPEIIYETVNAKPTETQVEIVKELSKRASKVQANLVDPSIDNMLSITNDGRKLGLDQRVYNPMLPDEPNSKVNTCVSKVYEIWQETKQDKLTQLLFCDLSTPKPKPKDVTKAIKAENMGVNGAEVNALQHGTKIEEDEVIIEKEMPFSVYHDIKDKLIDLGVPEKEIAFIHDAKTEVQKKDLYTKVRNGDVRVMLGSTAKCGSGMNVQDRLVALHDLDAPWRPGDLRQRSGRIERQGNMNKQAKIFRYVTESTFDAYLWQTLENKQKFISQIMTSKSPVRSCDDLDESALSFAEIKALCAGNPKIKLKMDLDIEVAKLRLLKASHNSTKFKLEDRLLKYYPENIKASEGYIIAFEKDIVTLSENTPMADEFSPMTIKGDTLIDKDNAGAAILAQVKEVKGSESALIGSYRGFKMNLSYDSFKNQHTITLKGAMSHIAVLGSDVRGNLTRIDNALKDMPIRLVSAKVGLENLKKQQANAEVEKDKPFANEQELKDKSSQLAKLDAELNLGNNSNEEVENEEPKVMAKSSRPSVLDNLKSIKKDIVEPKVKKDRNEVR